MKIDAEKWAKENHRSGWRKDPFEMLRDFGEYVRKESHAAGFREALTFPKYDGDGGWTIDPKFLQQIDSIIDRVTGDCGCPNLEEIESVLRALQIALLPQPDQDKFPYRVEVQHDIERDPPDRMRVDGGAWEPMPESKGSMMSDDRSTTDHLPIQPVEQKEET